MRFEIFTGQWKLPFWAKFQNIPLILEATYQMEYYFRKYTEDKDAPGFWVLIFPFILSLLGIMRLWLGPKPIVIVYKPETAKVVLESEQMEGKYSIYL
jgi:hypothetical protein